MKKLFLISILFFFGWSGGFCQSLLITPNKVESKQTNASDNIILQSISQPNILGKRQNGTLASPTNVVTNDALLSIQASGYNGSAFSTVRGSIKFEASQNWNSTNNGNTIRFSNTANNSTNLTERMVIDQNGKVGIGLSLPSYNLEIVQDSDSDNGIGLRRFGSGADNAPSIVGISARGNLNSPNATRTGDVLVKFGGRGHDGTAYTTSASRIDMMASEIWNATSRGTDMLFHTTANGSTSLQQRMIIANDGKLGLGMASTGYNFEMLATSDNAMGIKRFGGDAPAIFGISARGSINSPTATQNGDVLFRIGGRGHDGTGFSTSRARIEFQANQDWNTTDNGVNMRFYTTLAGTTTTSEKMVIAGSGNVGIGETSPESKLTVNGDLQLGIDSHYSISDQDITYTALNRNGKSIIRFDGSSKFHIKGIGGGVEGLVIHLVSTYYADIKLYFLSQDAADGNKIDTSENDLSDITITDTGGCTLIYLGGIWRVIGLQK